MNRKNTPPTDGISSLKPASPHSPKDQWTPRGQFRIYWSRFANFIDKDLWQLHLDEYHILTQIVYTFLRVVYIVFQGLKRNRLTLQAASLTFITLMSLVPFLAFIFSLTKGIKVEDSFRKAMAEHLLAMPDQVRYFIGQLFELVDTTSFAALGVIGLIIFFWAVLKLIATIESTFNTIWQIPNDRVVMRKLSDYLLVVLLSPVFIMLASGTIVTIVSRRITVFFQFDPGRFTFILELLTGFSGMVGLVGAFAFLYRFMPNTKVRFFAACVGGIISSSTLR